MVSDKVFVVTRDCLSSAPLFFSCLVKGAVFALVPIKSVKGIKKIFRCASEQTFFFGTRYSNRCCCKLFVIFCFFPFISMIVV